MKNRRRRLNVETTMIFNVFIIGSRKSVKMRVEKSSMFKSRLCLLRIDLHLILKSHFGTKSAIWVRMETNIIIIIMEEKFKWNNFVLFFSETFICKISHKNIKLVGVDTISKINVRTFTHYLFWGRILLSITDIFSFDNDCVTFSCDTLYETHEIISIK